MDKGQANKSNPSQPSSPAKGKYINGVFVSYGWVDESERTVNELEQAFEKHGIHMVRDKRDLRFRDSIVEFMRLIGQGQCVVLVISDKYLRSEYCMYELLEISKNENLRDRVFPIVLPDARIYNPVERLSYVRYWDQRIKELKEEIGKVDVPADLDGAHADLNRFVRIRHSIDHLTDILRDMNALTPEMHARDDYSLLINQVKEAMAEQKSTNQAETHVSNEVVSQLQNQEEVKPPLPVGGRGCEANFRVMVVIAGVGILLAALMFTPLTSIVGSLFSRPSPIPTITATLTPSEQGTPTPNFTPTLSATISAPPCLEQSLTRYGFDCGFKLWAKSGDSEIKAVTEVTKAQVPDQQEKLTTVMVLTVDFTGGPDDRRTDFRELGEVQVNLSDFPPTGYEHTTVGDDLVGQTITANVWASKGASGDPAHLNGFQLFLRDEKSVSCYGNWTNIEPVNEEEWFRIVWKEPTMKEKEEDPKRCDPKFDVTKPKILGLKIAVGTNSQIEYDAPLTVYLDDVDWLSP